MKIERLVEIINIMQEVGKTTMTYLSEKTNVSRRTVYRDIDIICNAGIPIVTSQGVDGGVEIKKGFYFDTSAFTKEELQKIFSGDKGGFSHTDELSLTGKLVDKGNAIALSDNILLDLSPIYKGRLSEKMLLLKRAIDEKKCVSFLYFRSKGETEPIIEPALLIFRGSDWYIFGYCSECEDFCTFKLSRIWNLQITDKVFEQRDIPIGKLNAIKKNDENLEVTAIYDASEKYRLVEEKGMDSFQSTDDGKLIADWKFPNYKMAVRWFMSFGDKVEVVAPTDFRESYADIIRSALKKYEK